MSVDLPTDNGATWSVLTAGYVAGGVASTVVLVVEGDMVAVVDRTGRTSYSATTTRTTR